MPADPTGSSALERLVRDGAETDIRRFVQLLQPPELADLVEALPNAEDRARVLRAMARRDRPDVVRDMDDVARTEMLEDMSVSETAELVGELQSDDAADVLQDLDQARQEAVLQEIEPTERAELRQILEHAPESAGGIMQTELVAVDASWNAAQAVEEIRRTRDEVGELHEIFVVDAARRLQGWLTERTVILAEDDTPIRGLVRPVPVQVPVAMDQEEIASLVRDYDVSSVPVVDDAGTLLGRVLVDDIVDVIEEEATEDIARLAGTGPDDIYDASLGAALRSRSPWLLLTFLGGVCAAQIMRAGESAISAAGALPLFAFIPVIMGMGGGCSTQAATVTVRSLALGRLDIAGVWRVVRKELMVGVVLALSAALLLWVAAWLQVADARIAWVAALAILGAMVFGAAFGVVTPLLFRRLGIDPAVAAAPFVTTANDILGSTLIILAAQSFL